MDDHEVQLGLEMEGNAASSGEVNINDGGVCMNKVVSSSPAKDEWYKGEEGVSGSTHAKIKCMRRYRIKVKGCCVLRASMLRGDRLIGAMAKNLPNSVMLEYNG